MVEETVSAGVAVSRRPDTAGRRRWQFARSFVRSPAGVLGLILILTAVITSVFAPALAPHDPSETDFTVQLTGPSLSGNFVGTDELGRDIFSRVLYGGRVSLQVSLGAVGIALIVGTLLGLIAGFFGRWVDLVIMRIMDAQLAIPGLILAIVLATSLGASLRNVTIAIGVAAIPAFARLTRGEVLRIRERDYVLAAWTLGASSGRVMVRHVLPNILAPLIVQTSIGLAGAILTEAALGFLGVGVPPPTPSWGGIVQQGYPYLEQAPWIVFSGGFAIAATVLGFSLLGDGLRDALDPRLRNR